MTHMKLSSKEATEAMPTAMPEKPEYPYGLRLRLEKEELEKLGIKELPKVGEIFTVEAKAHVLSVSAGASQEHEHASMDLQITHMGLGEDGEVKSAHLAKKMYGEMKDGNK